MTEAAVARERAKLYSELKHKIDNQVLAANADELASLRDRQAMTNPYCFFLYQVIPNWLCVLMNAVRSITGMYFDIATCMQDSGIAAAARSSQSGRASAAPGRRRSTC